jgi:hypothetical protein
MQRRGTPAATAPRPPPGATVLPNAARARRHPRPGPPASARPVQVEVQGSIAMRNPLGIIIVIVGVVLLVLGIGASDSVSSSFSKLFTGAPSDKSIWLIITGLLAIGVGAVVSWRGSST